MKILHIAPNAPYNRGWGYQENLLPKHQKKLGHDVTVIVRTKLHRDGQIVDTPPEDVILEDGVRLIRMDWARYPHPVITNLRARMDVYPILEQIRPDLVFFHGLMSSTIFQVIRYKKTKAPELVVVQDNHLDDNIGLEDRTLKGKLVRSYYRWMCRRAMPYVARVYGVTPWRERYAQKYFKIPAQKTDVLIMGADDEKLDFAHRDHIRRQIRQRYGISEDDLLVVTGGKIDEKKNIHLLMEACKGCSGVKLLVFGLVDPALEETFHRLLQQNEDILYIGWIDADRVYDYFFAADLVMFPGQHSVLWEQACASKAPCVFARWDGMEHLDNGGNSEFLDPVTVESIREKIARLHHTPRYAQMKAVAESDATDIFRYSMIAARSLECVTGK